MTYKLFIDDLRDPCSQWLLSGKGSTIVSITIQNVRM